MEGDALLKLSDKWIDYLNAKPESGMGYTIVTVVLRDRRRFEQCIYGSGYISRIRGRPDVPFTVRDIENILVTHDKWDFNAELRPQE